MYNLCPQHEEYQIEGRGKLEVLVGSKSSLQRFEMTSKRPGQQWDKGRYMLIFKITDLGLWKVPDTSVNTALEEVHFSKDHFVVEAFEFG